MVSFACDYLEGCHEEILKALLATNMVQEPGYGTDTYTLSAKAKIRTACQSPDAEVYFVNGGTQTNQLVIDTMLQAYEGVVAARTGHVNVHEAGAIEFSGHKVLTVPSYEGKVHAEDVRTLIETFYADESYEHMVFPGMLYISHPTEYGTLYTAGELKELSQLCREKHIPLFLDGARLGYGLQAKNTDVTLPMIAELCDVFYIGGTKVGALSGEAIVFPRKEMMPLRFLTQIKQHGALSAKGRLLGIQFDTLFTDDLYFKNGAHAIEMAEQLKQIFADAGFSFLLNSPTNQQFVILDKKTKEELEKHVGFEVWEVVDEDHIAVRFATSWATKPESLDVLRDVLKKCKD